MKKISLLIFLLLAAIVAGCNDEDKVTRTESNVQTDEKNGGQAINSALPFIHFDLDVEYAQDVDFSADYESERNGLEAEINDERTNRRLQGDEAFTELSPILEQLAFRENTSEEEVIAEVLDAFQLDDNFVEFELEVTFANGTRKKYQQRK